MSPNAVLDMQDLYLTYMGIVSTIIAFPSTDPSNKDNLIAKLSDVADQSGLSAPASRPIALLYVKIETQIHEPLILPQYGVHPM